MKNSYNNIYKIARKLAELTQEEAAEFLNVSVRSLADYEAGKTIPNDDIVLAMIDLYKSRWLAYSHLKHSTMIGQKYLPDLQFDDLSLGIIKLRKEMKDVYKAEDEIDNILCDGKIDKDEKPVWDKILKEINDVISAAFGIIFTKDVA